MNKTKYIFLVLALVGAAGYASAQSLNPSVVVTNTYEGSVSGSVKQTLPMNVPDSLLKFDYQIDYSVFDNPYNGSYEFHPYLVEMRPDPKSFDGKRFYLNAGAGYSLHPELDMVWSPMLQGDFSIGVYDTFRGYIGKYKDYDGTPGDAGRFLENRLGVGGRWESSVLDLSFDAGYHLLNAADSLFGHGMNAGDFTVRVKSKDDGDSKVYYDVKLFGEGLKDNNSGRGGLSGSVGQFDGRLGGTVGYRVRQNRRAAVDAGLRFVGASGPFSGKMFQFNATPQYLMDFERAHVKLGVKLSLLSSNHVGQIVYPDVSADYFIIPDRLDVYARVEGGDYIDSYSSLLKNNPFIHNEFCNSVAPGTLSVDNHTDRVDAVIGFRGMIGCHMHFDVNAGYKVGNNNLADALFGVDDKTVFAIYRRCNFNTFHAGLGLVWESERLSAEGRFGFTDTDALRNGNKVLAPSAFGADVTATYNIGDRIFFGIDLCGRTERKGMSEVQMEHSRQISVPGYVDFGVHGEYRINRWLSAWLKGGNLFGQPVQTYLLHVEQSPNFTAGICVKL